MIGLILTSGLSPQLILPNYEMSCVLINNRQESESLSIQIAGKPNSRRIFVVPQSRSTIIGSPTRASFMDTMRGNEEFYLETPNGNRIISIETASESDRHGARIELSTYENGYGALRFAIAKGFCSPSAVPVSVVRKLPKAQIPSLPQFVAQPNKLNPTSIRFACNAVDQNRQSIQFRLSMAIAAAPKPAQLTFVGIAGQNWTYGETVIEGATLAALNRSQTNPQDSRLTAFISASGSPDSPISVEMTLVASPGSIRGWLDLVEKKTSRRITGVCVPRNEEADATRATLK
jgi:hypothetical protein